MNRLGEGRGGEGWRKHLGPGELEEVKCMGLVAGVQRAGVRAFWGSVISAVGQSRGASCGERVGAST